MALEEIVEHCQNLYDDLDFSSVIRWKNAASGRKVIGHMPVYVPRELIHAAGMLPVGILGGGDQLDVIHGDAYYQSYICRIPRSTIELAVTGRLDVLDGMLFPSTCDVIRNLSGMWQLKFQDKFVRYVDVPQDFDLDDASSPIVDMPFSVRHLSRSLKRQVLRNNLVLPFCVMF